MLCGCCQILYDIGEESDEGEGVRRVKEMMKDIAGGEGSTVKCFAKTKGSTRGLEGGSTTGSCMTYSTYLWVSKW